MGIRVLSSQLVYQRLFRANISRLVYSFLVACPLLEEFPERFEVNRLGHEMVYPGVPRLQLGACGRQTCQSNDTATRDVVFLLVLANRSRCRHAVHDGHGHICGNDG
jgi:hypothetical protein